MAVAEYLVGRAEQLGTLDDLLAAADGGRPLAVEVVGEPGIGKTRLLSELVDRADAAGHLVLSGAASELERDLPFGVFVDALDEYLRGLEPRRLDALDDDVRNGLANVFPSLAELATAEGTAFRHERHRSHRAVRELFERLTGISPLVLVLDDVHWADPASIDLLGALLRRPPDAAVLLVLALRPQQAPERLSMALEPARRAGTLTQVELNALTRDEATELIGGSVDEAIAFAGSANDRAVEWTAHWGIAVLAGLTGNAAELARHVREAHRIAEELRSPVLAVWTNEVSIEYASGIGDWQSGLALAERTIPIARALGANTLLPRLLVWTGLMHLGRGELAKAKALFDESWTVSGAANAEGGAVDVHTAVPAHTGMAAYALATGDRKGAIALGEAGVALADRSGYVAWSIHRLIPIIIEAALWLQDFARVQKYGERLRRDSTLMKHTIGMAWATASDALVARLRDADLPRAVELLGSAADQLDAVPFVFDAARIRRNLAQLLVALGDRDGAARELRRAHDVLARIGAESELRGARDQLRDLGARPPALVIAEGAGALTGREREIARLVAARKSNKEIGTALGISSRTVSTHLSNVFAKLGVTSRGELTDRVREDSALRS